jgi:hypothetical protein
MRARPITAVVAVLFAALTVAAYGSGTGPGTTGSGGPNLVDAVQQRAPSPGIRIVTQAVPTPARGEADETEHDGEGRGLGNTYCQSLKGTGGPAFGHCIAAKAHELHQHGKHR